MGSWDPCIVYLPTFGIKLWGLETHWGDTPSGEAISMGYVHRCQEESHLRISQDSTLMTKNDSVTLGVIKLRTQISKIIIHWHCLIPPKMSNSMTPVVVPHGPFHF